MGFSGNRGEWSELYAFIRLLKDGNIFAADEYVNRIESIYFPILKLIRADKENQDVDYLTGKPIRIYKNGNLLEEISSEEVEKNANILFSKIFNDRDNTDGAFSIPDIDSFLDKMRIAQIKSPSTEKIDIRMQLHDINTGYDSIKGFSIKSDLGQPPTLLNAGKNTRFRYEIAGIDDNDMEAINSIDKSVSKEYVKLRFLELFSRAKNVRYSGMISEVFENNLMLIDSMLPEIYGDFILYHYLTMQEPHVDCESICKVLEINNPIGYRKKGIYTYKIKKLLAASALGMTPGKEWDGNESATGGYIIVKRDGDVLCYHLYNRNFFEEYLLRNTTIDRPSATRYEYAFVYKDNGKFFIDLNIQIRFKSISASKKSELNDTLSTEQRLNRYAKLINEIFHH